MSNALSLYTLSSQVEQLLDSDDAYDPETGELSEALTTALGATRDKARDVCAFILNRDAQIAAIEAHEAQVAARKAILVRRQEKLRQYLQDQMKRTGMLEIAANDGTFAAKLYIERDASVEIFDEKQVPITYYTVPKTPDPKISKSEISKAIKAGKEVPGARIKKADRLTIG
jgi:hypothetical protein